jgi:glutamate---cysteine ligase / carboxylate-amine ligase
MPDVSGLLATFDGVTPLTIGLEEELLLLEPGSFAPLPRASEVIARCGGDPRFKLELPAAQLEIVLPPASTVAECAAALAAARRDLTRAADGIGVLGAAGAHPLAPPLAPLNDGERYEPIAREYGAVAHMQLVGALQVHVAVGGHERALGVYNALRSYLPEIAALAANAPFYAGQDTGLASVRPKICDLLPRQGVPPAIPDWSAFAEALRWGRTAGSMPTAGQWWWELRPHPVHGTLELRVPDAQATVADAAAVSAFVHSLVAWLSDRHDAGDLPEPDPTWRIEENRWSACRHGLDAAFADLESGQRVPARELIAARLDALAPTARAIGAEVELEDVRRLLAGNGAERQRRAAAGGGGARAAAEWLVGAYGAGR